MKQKLNAIILLFLILASGCAVHNTIQAGCYEAERPELIDYYFLQLKPDSTYSYYFQGDMNHVEFEGTWKVKRSKLILNSYLQSDSKGYHKESSASVNNKVDILLFDIYGKSLDSLYSVYLQQDTGYTTINKSTGNRYHMDKEKLPVNFTINATGYKPTDVTLKNANSDKLMVYLVPDTRGYFQKELRLKIENNMLVSDPLTFKKADCEK